MQTQRKHKRVQQTEFGIEVEGKFIPEYVRADTVNGRDSVSSDLVMLVVQYCWS